MNLLDEYIEKAKQLKKRVVLPEGTEERILAAAFRLQKEGVCKPIVLGKKETIAQLAGKLGEDLEGLEVTEPALSSCFSELADLYVRKRKNISRPVAERLLARELMFGGMLLASGRADAMVAGASHPTASVIQAASLTIGYQPGISTPSSYFIMVLPDGKILFYADCGVNIDPDSRQLAEIGVATAASFKKLTGQEPKVAFLSFSSKGSASHPLVDKVAQAVKLAKEIAPDTALDGEFQGDTALSKEVAAKKLKDPGLVAGQANVLIFPDLNAGNIAYKLTQYLAKASAYGPILQGFARPVSDLSRGARVQDIVGAVAITCLQ